MRASLGKNHVILRLPVLEAHNLDKHIVHLNKWLSNVLLKKPAILNKYQISNIPTSLTVLGQHRYDIKMKFDKTDRGYGKLSPGEILLTIPKGIEEFEQRKMVRDLNSKLIAKIFKPTVEKRIDYWNDQYFQKDIKGITLRYNATNWGSCSHKSKINLSTRSLLLPQKAFDYIVVHELSHLIEMNHSQRFWDVVEKVMPDYKEQERYIKTNSSKIDF